MIRKIKSYLFIALVAVMVPVAAQVQFSVGLKAGPNFSKLNVDQSPGENYKNRAGFHGGAFMLVKISKVGIQPEVLFSKQGSKFSFNNDNLSSNFDYVNIPVVLKLYTVAGINLQLGPQISFLAKSGGQTIQTVNGVSTAVDASKDLYKKSDFGVVFGVGWDLPFGLMVE